MEKGNGDLVRNHAKINEKRKADWEQLKNWVYTSCSKLKESNALQNVVECKTCISYVKARNQGKAKALNYTRISLR